ncbi:MAG: hypothetical protein ACMXYA_03460 [Candidatus Woesearchaeota archaeon]
MQSNSFIIEGLDKDACLVYNIYHAAINSNPNMIRIGNTYLFHADRVFESEKKLLELEIPDVSGLSLCSLLTDADDLFVSSFMH